jgi:hypothetical protein
MVINQQGQIMAVKITKGNVDDRAPVAEITKGLQGVVAEDKGYITKKLFEECYRKGLKIITGIRKTMKNILMPFAEKTILRKRFFIPRVKPRGLPRGCSAPLVFLLSVVGWN